MPRTWSGLSWRKVRWMQIAGTGTVYEARPGYWRAMSPRIKVDGTTKRFTGTGRTQMEAITNRNQKILEFYNTLGIEPDVLNAPNPTANRSRARRRGAPSTQYTVQQWLDYWIKHADLTPKSRKSYESKISTYLLPTLRDVPLDELTTEMIEEVYSWMRDRGLAQNTIAQTHRILSRGLKVAVMRKHLEYNPADPIETAKSERNPMPTLTAEQTKKVFETAKEHSPMLLARMVCAFVLALRQYEALALQWDGDVHEEDDEPHLVVDKSLTRDTRGSVFGSTKTGTEDVIPLPEVFVPVFREARKQAVGPWVFPGRNPKKPITASGDNHRFHRILREAGVPRIPLHGARGTAGSVLADLGVPLTTVAAILRHKDVATTVRHYARADRRMAQAGLDKLAEHWKDVL